MSRIDLARALYEGFAVGDREAVERLIEHGDEVVVTYERTREDGGRGRNTEVLTFDGERIVRAEVYFGWNLP